MYDRALVLTALAQDGWALRRASAALTRPAVLQPETERAVVGVHGCAPTANHAASLAQQLREPPCATQESITPKADDV